MIHELSTSTSLDYKIRVLVVENHSATRLLHRQNLEWWGYEPYVAEGFDDDLLRDAERKAHDYACHVALVDMRLRDDDDSSDKSGLDLVSKLKPTISIIFSGSGKDRVTVLQAIEKGAFDFVGKEEPFSRLQSAIDKAARAIYAHSFGAELIMHSKLAEQIMETLAPSKPPQVKEILRSLFPEAQKLTIKPLEHSARTPTLSSRQGAVVLRVSVDGRQPLIVKLERIAKIQKEAKNFDEYISDRLPGGRHPRIRTWKILWHIGGIVYDFIGGDVEKFQLFSEYYREAPVKRLQEVLRHLFDETWGKLSMDTRRPMAAESLLTAYSNVWGPEWKERLCRFEQNQSPRLMLLNRELINPLIWVIKHIGLHENSPDDSSITLSSSIEAITHGDLLGGNIFVDEDNHTWTIDFERSGYGPVLQDFVQLETDILVRLAGFDENELNDYCQLIIAITSTKELPQRLPPYLANEKARKAFWVVAKLRKLAQKFLPSKQDYWQYYWGILLNTAFRATLIGEKYEKTTSPIEDPETWKELEQERKHALLLGSIICELLEHWDKPWPPNSWKNILSTSTETSQVQNINRKISSSKKRLPPTGYLLSIGVGTVSASSELNLPVTADDAQAVWETFTNKNFYAYPSNHAQLLQNKTATKELILAKLAWLADQTFNHPHSTTIIYFSGHGLLSAQGKFGLVPSDFNSQEPVTSMVSAKDFIAALADIESERLLIILDCCHAGGIVASDRLPVTLPLGFRFAPVPRMVANEITTRVGKAIISACSSNQQSYIRIGDNLSLFTRHLIQLLLTPFESSGGSEVNLRVLNLADQLTEAVRKSAWKELHQEQIPWCVHDGENFSLTLRV